MEVNFDSTSEESEEEDARDDARLRGDAILDLGGQEWKLMEGRTVDPFEQNGYHRNALFKLHNYMEKTSWTTGWLAFLVISYLK